MRQPVTLATPHRGGIATARKLRMTTDFLALLRRDHDDLQRGITELLEPNASLAQIRASLDGVRLGLTAHAEAEDIVVYAALARCEAALVLEELVSESREAHLGQETALRALVCTPLGTDRWRDRARQLRELVRDHAALEEQELVPAIRELAPRGVYVGLAGAFATERLRQLAMLQPSAPIYAVQLAAS